MASHSGLGPLFPSNRRYSCWRCWMAGCELLILRAGFRPVRAASRGVISIAVQKAQEAGSERMLEEGVSFLLLQARRPKEVFSQVPGTSGAQAQPYVRQPSRILR